MLLSNKIALITGSSRGIGRAIAERLAAEGASVVINYTSNPEFPEAFGPMAASMSTFNRVGNVQEVADVALFLASEQSRWITGQNIQSNGGVV